MITYPLPTPNPANIIQTDNLSAKDEQHREAMKHIASEAASHDTYESYKGAIDANTLSSVPAPNEENINILIGDEYISVKDFYDAVMAGAIVDIDTMRVKLVRMRSPPGMTIKGPEDMLTYAKSMSDYDREHLKVFHLDTANQVVGIENISTGTLGSTTAHPREVIKGAILNNSAGVIIAHNHPSGATAPSAADKRVAQGLINAFALVDIKVLDFVIMANDTVKSFSDDGIMPTVSPFVREMGDKSGHGDACNVAYQAAIEVMGEKCEKDD